MNEHEVLQILAQTKAIITDSHIVYTSGKHGAVYVNKDAVYPHTVETSWLCSEIAGRFAEAAVEVVIAPAIGGVILSQWTAHGLFALTGRDVLAVYAEKQTRGGVVDYKGEMGEPPEEYFAIKRGYDKLIPGKNVLVVEDVLTTGGSAKKVIEAVRLLGGNVVGLGVLCNRGGITPEDVGAVPKLTALVDVKLDSWDEADCPLCAQGIPINTDVGKGREFLARTRKS